MQTRWNGWRKVLEVMSDKSISSNESKDVKIKQCWEPLALRKMCGTELEGANNKMLSFSLELTGRDRFENMFRQRNSTCRRLKR